MSGRRLLVLRARSQTQRAGREGHDHDCFENFQLVIRLLSLLIAARHLGSYDQTRNAFLDFFRGARALGSQTRNCHLDQGRNLILLAEAMTVSKHTAIMLRGRFLCTIALAVLSAFAGSGLFADGRPRNELVLAKSAEDEALRARLVALSPSVNPEEARRVASVAYTTGLELAAKWQMGSSPTVHSFLINIGVKKGGYCYQFATELLLRLDAQKLKTLELHWAESDPGTDTEHNVIAVTARGQPFAEGIMLDNWRHSGHLLWGPLNGDPSHTWQENKEAFARRMKRKPVTSERSQARDKSSRKSDPKRD